MATRYSGALTIRLAWNDRTSYYDASVSWIENAGSEWARHRTRRVRVGHPPASRIAVDAPEAYDSAAKAAIAFADDEYKEDNIGEMAEHDFGTASPMGHAGSYAVRRTPRGELHEAAGAAEGAYPYKRSPSGQYVLRHDGREVMRGTEGEIWKYLHTHHSYSVEHAIRHEGYSVRPVEAGEASGEAKDQARDQAVVIFDAARRQRVLGPLDEDAITELDLYIENTGELYPMKQAIRANLAKKMKKGVYDDAKAILAWAHWVEAGAKAYAKEVAGEPKKWNVLFPKPERDALAMRIAGREYATIKMAYMPPPPPGGSGGPPPGARETTTAKLEPVGCVPEVRLQKSPGFEKCMAVAKKLGAVDSPRKVEQVVRSRIGKADQEHFVVLLLNVKNHVKAIYLAALGQQSHVTVGIADVLKVVLDTRAAGFIVAHNHPTGDPQPSDADKALTKHLAEAAKPYAQDMTFIDHVVIGSPGRHYSLREHDPSLFK